MTCIAAVTHKGKVWMGGDSAAVSILDLTVRRDRKVFELGEFLIGFTTSFRMGQILQYGFKPPALPPGVRGLHRYMSTAFVDAVQELFVEKNLIEAAHKEGGTFLVGVRGQLFSVESDFQVEEAAQPFNACGCGAQVALGALYAGHREPPRARVANALHAAERFSAGVRAPFYILER